MDAPGSDLRGPAAPLPAGPPSAPADGAGAPEEDLYALLPAAPAEFLRRLAAERRHFDRAQADFFAGAPDPELVRALLERAGADPAAAQVAAMLELAEPDLAELLDRLPGAAPPLAAAILTGVRFQPANLDRGAERLASILCAAGGGVQTTATLAELRPLLRDRGSPVAAAVTGALRAASNDPGEEVRRFAARGLTGPDGHAGAGGEGEAAAAAPTDPETEFLTAWYRRESASAVRLELVRSLAGSRDALHAALASDPAPAVRRLAAEWARHTLAPADRPGLEALLAREADPEVRQALADTIELLGEEP